MNFILIEEFLKQNKEVQEVFMEWWKPQIGDLVYDRISIVGVVVPVLCMGQYRTNLDKTKVTPLLQINQLIRFIEDKTECKIEIDYYTEEVSIYLNSLDNDGISHYKYSPFENFGLDLLKALWKIACIIALEQHKH